MLKLIRHRASVECLSCLKCYDTPEINYLFFNLHKLNGDQNISVQYNGGLLPDIILLTQCYYHRGTHLNAMKMFCLCSL